MQSTNIVLSSIYEGMAVFDKNIRNVGSVVFTYEGGSSTGLAPNTAVQEAVATASERLPADVIHRLYDLGFIKVSTGGFFPMMRFVALDQVADVDTESEKLYLSVAENELLKG